MQEVFALAKRFIAARAQSQAQKELLSAMLRRLERQSADPESLPFIVMPRLVVGAVRGLEEEASGLCLATTLLYAGIDLLDDLADGDISAAWRGFRPQELQLAAATFLSSLPQLALSDIKAPPAVLAGMHKALAQGLLRMSAGQQEDLSTAGSSHPDSAAVELSVSGKSGEELALFSRLGALMAQAPESAVDLYEDMGRSLGTAIQLASDCHDLFQARRSRDLANGTRTYPIAKHLERLPRAERGKFLRVLELAKTSSSAAKRVRRELIQDGTLRLCAIVVEIHCQKAVSCLERAQPKLPAAAGLKRLILSASFFAEPRATAPTPPGQEVFHEPSFRRKTAGSLDERCAVQG
ncbi:MAG: polyprenyl synthetase family protein [Elusimicrobia bacterium]|nr:polyprenyl synthetase family protein [Elusimicrobiota bacterium]